MTRNEMINVVGNQFHTANIEGGEFSYVKEAGSIERLHQCLGYDFQHYKLDIRFKSDELRLKSFLKRFDILDNSYSTDGTLFIDGNLLPSFELCDYFENQINKLNVNISFVYKDEEIAYFYLNDTLKNIEKVEIEESFVHKINYLWEALDFNANEIEGRILNQSVRTLLRPHRSVSGS